MAITSRSRCTHPLVLRARVLASLLLEQHRRRQPREVASELMDLIVLCVDDIPQDIRQLAVGGGASSFAPFAAFAALPAAGALAESALDLTATGLGLGLGLGCKG